MRKRVSLIVTMLLCSAAILSAQQSASLRISGNGISTVEITDKDLSKMPRLTVDVTNTHNGALEHYEGVRLSDLLARAGVTLGDKLRGRSLATYVVAQASD